MSEIYRALMRASRDKGLPNDDGSLRDRIMAWMPKSRAPKRESRPAPMPVAVKPTPPADDVAVELRQEIASLQVSVDALDDRLSAEVVEREAKLLEAIDHGMRVLKHDLSDRIAASVLETRLNLRLAAALVVVLVAGLSGLVVGVLAVV
jgi:hypothetical protein